MAASPNRTAFVANGNQMAVEIRNAPIAGPNRLLPTSSTLHNRPLAVSSRSCETSEGNIVWAALSRNTSAVPTISAQAISIAKRPGMDVPVSGGATSGRDMKTASTAAAKVRARSTSMARIRRWRFIRSVTIPAGRANTNHGTRKATGMSATSNGSRDSSDAIQAQTTTAIPSARFVKPLATMKRDSGVRGRVSIRMRFPGS